MVCCKACSCGAGALCKEYNGVKQGLEIGGMTYRVFEDFEGKCQKI